MRGEEMDNQHTPAQMPRRPNRRTEVFDLICWQCCGQVEIPCSAPHRCPRCEAVLHIVWREQLALVRQGLNDAA